MPRKQKKYHFIYKTTNLVNGKFYVGMHSTDDLEDGYFGSGKILNYSINKHGIENHKVEILEFTESRDSLKKREAEIVNEELLSDPLNMNLKFGGEGGWDSSTFDITARNKKCREKFKHKIDNDLEFKHRFQQIANANLLSTESQSKAKATKIEKFGNAICPNLWGKGSKHSEATKEKLRKTKNVGKQNPQFGTCWICRSKEAKKIKKEELQFWIENGWRKGRK